MSKGSELADIKPAIGRYAVWFRHGNGPWWAGAESQPDRATVDVSDSVYRRKLMGRG